MMKKEVKRFCGFYKNIWAYTDGSWKLFEDLWWATNLFFKIFPFPSFCFLLTKIGLKTDHIFANKRLVQEILRV